ncbi:MAG: glucoamylase family protein [Gemmatimonadota bacterium]
MRPFRSWLLDHLVRARDRPEDLLTGPIHGTLLGADRLAERARTIAAEQVVGRPQRLDPRARLLHRLENSRRILTEAEARLIAEPRTDADRDPSADWLLDNFHLVQEHIQEVRDALPRTFYRELPELANGPLRGYPRIYEIAIAVISHSEGRVVLENVDHFVEAYQAVTPLTLGELWAMPAMLRLGLIESLRRMTRRTLHRLDELAAADAAARRLEAASDPRRGDAHAVLGGVVGPDHAVSAGFLARLHAELRGRPERAKALAHLEHWLSAEGLASDALAAQANERVAHTQIMTANSIMSLRTIGRRDWRTFVERQSVVETVLARDPSGHYLEMTFATRDRYRHAIERLARRCGISEQRVAECAIALAARPHSEALGAARRGHVGYYLIDAGLQELEGTCGAPPSWHERFLRALRARPNVVLVGGLVFLTLLALGALGMLAGGEVTRVAWPAILLFALLPAWDIGITVVNQLITSTMPPRTLPAMDFLERGIPDDCRTAVVVPTLLGDVDDVTTALEDLEVLFLANRDPALVFALLGDHLDAEREHLPGDAAVLEQAALGVTELNLRYGTGAQPPFRLLHRPRRWNPGEGVWMGWERKRGKLEEFLELLAGQDSGAFTLVAGGAIGFEQVRYVITLDADTQMPLGEARALVGTIAHPLNRAVHDPAAGRIVAGFGIIQPRIAVKLVSARRSAFAAIHSGLPGIDPYTTAVSDFYQDLFGEGSFTGKGIIDVAAFRLATRGRFPENTLLSHDLIEGNYVRAGLATDIVLYDDYPTTYIAHARRKHRWVRGDWQLLPWLGRHVPGPSGPELNRLPLVSRWKVLDNLRRSTVEPAQLALIIAGWSLLAGSSVRWTLLGIGAIVAPRIVPILLAFVRPPRDRSWRAYYGALRDDAVRAAQQIGLAIVVLPHQAWLSLDAIVRTLWRLGVSRRHLLEWHAAARVERTIRNTSDAAWRQMGPSLVAVVVAAISMTILDGRSAAEVGGGVRAVWPQLLAIWPLTLLWLTGPLIVTRLSRVGTPSRLSDAHRDAARRYAEAHWRFFDEFVTAETGWLAPDNVQAKPVEAVAMRTSPTNIGLQLLATVSAVDLGLLSRTEMVERLERTFGTLDTLARYRGHFHNWYDLEDGRVLDPPYISTVDSGNLAGHLLAFAEACREHGRAPGVANSGDESRLASLATRAERFVHDMDFAFLYDTATQLFTIGYHPESHTADASSYDLLASEARLAVYVAIAKGDVPVDAWFRLGRLIVRADGRPMLASWSGSMFEYLMPLLVMPAYAESLLGQTDHAAVASQVAYGRRRDVPWGVSESAYNLRDQQLTYQYRAFGVPGTGLRRGLDRDLVIAPYASALAAMLAPTEAFENLKALERLGALGPHGFWDALDYSRPDPGRAFAVVETVMAHHVGMSLVAFANVLGVSRWPERFLRVPTARAAELLLQERVPRSLVAQVLATPVASGPPPRAQGSPAVVRMVMGTETALPRIGLLGDLSYAVMVTHAGGGYSRHAGLDVTRWRADGTTDDRGQFCYLKDVGTGRCWSAGFQPVGAMADEYHAHLAADAVTLHRIDGPVETRTEIVVVQSDAAEVRRITVTNHGPETREIELTSYAEIVMGPTGADAPHPAFANLFVETEWHAWCSAITARRRPRAGDEPAPWYVHVVASGPERVGEVSCETDRAQFVGRGRSARRPMALDETGPLSGTTGAVLDPVGALRVRIRIDAGQSASVAFTTLVADSREAAFELADRYRGPIAAQRALELSWMATQIDLREWKVTSQEAAAFQDIAGHLLFGPPDGDAGVAIPDTPGGAQASLWRHGISGDQPILLATIDDTAGLATLRGLLAAHRYWRRHALVVDLVVLIGEPHDYLQALRTAIEHEMQVAGTAQTIDVAGGVYLRRRDSFEPEDLQTLQAIASLHVPCDGRSLDAVVPVGPTRRADTTHDPLRPHYIERRVQARPTPTRPTPGSHDLTEGNGYGGLTEVGNYRLRVAAEHLPPAPWANVVANPLGGFLMTERGSGCTWAENAYFFRLTPWRNDPVSDEVSDAIYLRDEASGMAWSVTPGPMGGGGEYEVEHGPGVSTYTLEHDGIRSVVRYGMPTADPVKVARLALENRSDRPRQIRVTAYAEWTLGVRSETTRGHIETDFDVETGTLLARNKFAPDFNDRVAFLATSDPVQSHTADRREFLGRHGSLADPAALRRDRLGGRTGIGLDPCAAVMSVLELAPGATHELVVLLGAAPGRSAALETIARYRDVASAATALKTAEQAWDARLGTIQVQTPDPALDALLNRWLFYQALSSRMWARTGLYQSSGAYGFRDQLQDVMAFVHAEPGIAREHIIRAASRQFVEGDVQHWWHPHTGRGVRTRFSDDLVWLAYVVEHYVRVTGDSSILDEEVSFIEMRELRPDEHEIYDLPRIADERGSVHQHCVRALRRACTHGVHDLPLIGSGDWNDGFSRIGIDGKGESVWLAWFLIDTLTRYGALAERQGAGESMAWGADHARRYREAAESAGWDGEWYRRAYFDDGTPLGTANGIACQIDSIAQSWSVLSRAGRPDRQATAMEALQTHLVSDELRLIRLLTPPFDGGELDPGYIKGYLPGVRENGAQYTHAALWAVMATAELGDGDRAMTLFQMLNPLTHTATPEGVARYKVEPYVVAADVYTAAGQEGRGGWTWYTGSASWMYRVGLEELLGFRREGTSLRISPVVPRDWPAIMISYRYGTSEYRITVEQPAKVGTRGGVVTVDGHRLESDKLTLVDDGSVHVVTITPNAQEQWAV